MADGKWITDLPPTTPVTDAARRVLALRLEAVRDALPFALHKADQDPEYIHQLRVSTRRAGASLAIFACCLPQRELRAAQKGIRCVRRVAGAARDWDVFLGKLPASGQAPPRWRPALDFLKGCIL